MGGVCRKMFGAQERDPNVPLEQHPATVSPESSATTGFLVLLDYQWFAVC